jgi:asparagine synthase (glutamine-hydrolysing)
MTALAGLWRFDRRPDAADGCARMLRAQEPYGPDHGAQWSGDDIALGRRLMRTLPEDVFDRQPLVGGQGRYVLVADVRLDNRGELAEELQISAPQARDLCDAAILLTVIERWGEACVEHIVGDYAFAFWDVLNRKLFLARDPTGQRPLHYHRGDKFFAFASMPKGLHALPDVPYAPDEERVAEFLALMPETGTQSFFRGIERVEPGHVTVVTAASLKARRHWQPRNSPLKLSGPAEYAEALRQRLDEAVRCRLRSTGNLGVFLSGGLDSGAVAATAARLLVPSGRKILAFTGVPRVGYDGPAPRNRIVDEGRLAAATAALYSNIEHILVPNKGRSPLADLDRFFNLLDRPMLNICGTAWAHSFNHAVNGRNIKVCLNGNLGNMGLSYNGLELLPELFRTGRWLRLWKEANALVSAGKMRWRGILANTLGPWCPPNLWVQINKLATGHAYEVQDYAAINQTRLVELDLPARAKAKNLDLVYRPWKSGIAMRTWAIQRVDSGNYNKATLGGWQVDTRDPTADVRLLEFCLSVPTEQFLRDGKQRALALNALADRLPRVVLDEPRRGLIGADWHEDLTAARQDVVTEIDRLEASSSASKAVNLARLRQLTERWPTDGWDRDDVIMPYRYALLRAISAGHFLRRTTGSNR